MVTSSRQQTWATLLYRTALAFGFLLSAMLLSAGMSFGFMDFDLGSPLAWWALVVMATPFLALVIRHAYQAHFNDARNLMLLGLGVAAIAALHVALTLSFA